MPSNRSYDVTNVENANTLEFANVSYGSWLFRLISFFTLCGTVLAICLLTWHLKSNGLGDADALKGLPDTESVRGTTKPYTNITKEQYIADRNERTNTTQMNTQSSGNNNRTHSIKVVSPSTTRASTTDFSSTDNFISTSFAFISDDSSTTLDTSPKTIDNDEVQTTTKTTFAPNGATSSMSSESTAEISSTDYLIRTSSAFVLYDSSTTLDTSPKTIDNDEVETTTKTTFAPNGATISMNRESTAEISSTDKLIRTSSSIVSDDPSTTLDTSPKTIDNDEVQTTTKTTFAPNGATSSMNRESTAEISSTDKLIRTSSSFVSDDPSTTLDSNPKITVDDKVLTPTTTTFAPNGATSSMSSESTAEISSTDYLIRTSSAFVLYDSSTTLDTSPKTIDNDEVQTTTKTTFAPNGATSSMNRESTAEISSTDKLIRTSSSFVSDDPSTTLDSNPKITVDDKVLTPTTTTFAPNGATPSMNRESTAEISSTDKLIRTSSSIVSDDPSTTLDTSPKTIDNDEVQTTTKTTFAPNGATSSMNRESTAEISSTDKLIRTSSSIVSDDPSTTLDTSPKTIDNDEVQTTTKTTFAPNGATSSMNRESTAEISSTDKLIRTSSSFVSDDPSTTLDSNPKITVDDKVLTPTTTTFAPNGATPSMNRESTAEISSTDKLIRTSSSIVSDDPSTTLDTSPKTIDNDEVQTTTKTTFAPNGATSSMNRESTAEISSTDKLIRTSSSFVSDDPSTTLDSNPKITVDDKVLTPTTTTFAPNGATSSMSSESTAEISSTDYLIRTSSAFVLYDSSTTLDTSPKTIDNDEVQTTTKTTFAPNGATSSMNRESTAEISSTDKLIRTSSSFVSDDPSTTLDSNPKITVDDKVLTPTTTTFAPNGATPSMNRESTAEISSTDKLIRTSSSIVSDDPSTTLDTSPKTIDNDEVQTTTKTTFAPNGATSSMNRESTAEISSTDKLIRTSSSIVSDDPSTTLDTSPKTIDNDEVQTTTKTTFAPNGATSSMNRESTAEISSTDKLIRTSSSFVSDDPSTTLDSNPKITVDDKVLTPTTTTFAPNGATPSMNRESTAEISSTDKLIRTSSSIVSDDPSTTLDTSPKTIDNDEVQTTTKTTFAPNGATSSMNRESTAEISSTDKLIRTSSSIVSDDPSTTLDTSPKTIDNDEVQTTTKTTFAPNGATSSMNRESTAEISSTDKLIRTSSSFVSDDPSTTLDSNPKITVDDKVLTPTTTTFTPNGATPSMNRESTAEISSTDKLIRTSSSIVSDDPSTTLDTSPKTIDNDEVQTTTKTTFAPNGATSSMNRESTAEISSTDKLIRTSSSIVSDDPSTTLDTSPKTIDNDEVQTTTKTTFAPNGATSSMNRESTAEISSTDKLIRTSSSFVSDDPSTTLDSNPKITVDDKVLTPTTTTFAPNGATPSMNRESTAEISSTDKLIRTSSSIVSDDPSTTLDTSPKTIDNDEVQTTTKTTFAPNGATSSMNRESTAEISSTDKLIRTSSSIVSDDPSTTLDTSPKTIDNDEVQTTTKTTFAPNGATSSMNRESTAEISSTDKLIRTSSSFVSDDPSTTLDSNPKITVDDKVLTPTTTTFAPNGATSSMSSESTAEISSTDYLIRTSSAFVLYDSSTTLDTSPKTIDNDEVQTTTKTTFAPNGATSSMNRESTAEISSTDKLIRTSSSIVSDDPSTTLDTSPKTTDDDEVQTAARMMLAPHATTPSMTSEATSKLCRQIASRVLFNMNHSADPCDDFYEYACGEFEANEQMSENDLEEHAIRRILDQAHKEGTSENSEFLDYYQSCVDYGKRVNESVRLEMAMNAINEVGRFYGKDETLGNEPDITDLLVKLFMVDSTPLFEVIPDAAVKEYTDGSKELNDNDSSYAWTIRHSRNLNSKLHSSGKEDHCYEKQLSAMKQKSVNLRKLHADYTTCTNTDNEATGFLESVKTAIMAFSDINPHVDSIMDGVKKVLRAILPENYPSEKEIRSAYIEDKFSSADIRKLNMEFRVKFLNWTKLFETLRGAPVNPNEMVQVSIIDKVRKGLKNVSKIDKKSFNDALLGLHVHKLYYELVAPQRDVEKYCQRLSVGLMKKHASRLYMSSFSEKERNEMNTTMMKIFADLKKTLLLDVTNQTWILTDNNTRIIKKIRHLSVTVPDISYFEGENELDKMKFTGDFISDTMMLRANYRKSMYKILDESPITDEKIWTHNAVPYQTQISTPYRLSKIIIPYGAIDWRFIWNTMKTTSSHMVLATLGTRIAREIVRHFDSTGVHYFGDHKTMSGIPALFWDDGEANRIFKDYIAYYKNLDNQTIFLPSTGQNVQYDLLDISVNERISDLAGLQLAYNAMLKLPSSLKPLPWLTGQDMDEEKQFFLAYAQMYCTKVPLTKSFISLYETEQLPSRLRISAVTSKNEFFNRVWNCSPSSGSRSSVFPKLQHVTTNAGPLMSQR